MEKVRINPGNFVDKRADFSKVEYRVPLTPQAVNLLVSYGHEILIERNAGKSASYSDKEYFLLLKITIQQSVNENG